MARLGSVDRRLAGPLTGVDLPSDQVSGMAHFDPKATFTELLGCKHHRYYCWYLFLTPP
jgi:hypothetical protein